MKLSSRTQLITQNSGLQALSSKESAKNQCVINSVQLLIRLPAPRYDADGRRINRGLRLDKDGSLLQTLDEFGNQIPGTHITEEKVRD